MAVGQRSTLLGCKRIGIRELNKHTSRYIARVKAGETIEVTEHGRLVARLVPAPRGPSKLDARPGGQRVLRAMTANSYPAAARTVRR